MDIGFYMGWGASESLTQARCTSLIGMKRFYVGLTFIHVFLG